MLGYEVGKRFSSSKGRRYKLTKVVAWRRVHCTGNELRSHSSVPASPVILKMKGEVWTEEWGDV